MEDKYVYKSKGELQMRYIKVFVMVVFLLMISNVSLAKDIYVCNENKWEVYVSTEKIMVNNNLRCFIKNGTALYNF